MDVAYGMGDNDVLLKMTTQVRECSPSQAMECLATRLQGLPEHDPEAIGIVAEMDEAVSCLMRDEQEELYKEQRVGQNDVEAVIAFHEWYRAKIRNVGGVAQPSPKRRKKKHHHCTDKRVVDATKTVEVFFPRL